MPRLAGITPTANTDTIAYTSPAGKRSTVSVNICNTSQNNAFVFLGLCASGSSVLAATDYIEYNTNIAPGNTLERTSLTPYNGERIIVRSNTSGVAVVVWGYEEA